MKNVVGFIFGKNDWIPVWADTGGMTYNLINNFTGQITENAGVDYYSYEILFSPSRKIHKLKISNPAAKRHSKYKEAIKKLAELNNPKK